ncbi:MAG: hypothetical protein U0133_06100 [Gemmatimonadales bacterium]
MSANSQPTALAAPITAIEAGAFSRNSASSELITVVLLISRPRADPFTRLPVAITTASFASCTSAPTFTFLPGWSTPSPLSTVTLCFFIRNSTPLAFCSETLRLRFIATP